MTFGPRRHVSLVALSVVAFACVELSALAGELRSGPQPGERLAATFEPLNVTGEHAGDLHCLVCEYGLSPVVMMFAREPSEALVQLLVKLDAATGKHRSQELGAFVVFLNDKPELQGELVALAKKQGLKHLVLAIDAPAGPDGFKVAAEADVTVVLYREHAVKANHAFRRGELDGKAAEKILADLPKILVEK